MTDFSIEDRFTGQNVCGLDEVGRGPLAGPVVAACVLIPSTLRDLPFVAAIKDSKKLSLKKRDMLYNAITQNFPYAIGEIFPEEIDRLNILQASLKAMQLAHESMSEKSPYALVDGNRAPALQGNVVTVVKGDQKSKTIAAASIVAKVHRDRIMAQLDHDFPHYGWAKNAGYPTAQHREALITHGISPHHRRSFAPVRKIVESAQ